MIHHARPILTSITAAIIAAVSIFGARTACGQVMADGVPKDLEGMAIVEHRGEQIPLDLSFIDENGKSVTLRDYFRGSGDMPVILTLNYYACPQLCTLTLNALVDAMDQIDLAAGDKFRIVTVSIDPREGPDLALQKKRNYMARYEHESSDDGWRFLTGTEQNIKTLADAVGFPYRFIKSTDQYAHPASIIICTPDGKPSRYLNTITPEPKDLRLALIEASEGKLGSAWDQFVLWCYHYDPKANSYTADAMKLMRLGGAVTVVIMGVGLFFLWRKDSHRGVTPNQPVFKA